MTIKVLLRAAKNRNNLYTIVIPTILFLIALLSKLFYINSRDICLDEPFTIFHAQKSILEILKLPTQGEPNPPLFMLLLHFWMKIFGNSPTSIRLLPLFFNSFTVVFLYQVGRKFFHLWTGILASGLFIVSTYHFYFGLEARTYSLVCLLTASSLFYFLSLYKFPKKRSYMLLLIVSNVLLIYSHYFGWFVVFVQFISAFLFLNDRTLFRKIIISLLATGIAFIPMAIVFIKQFLISSKGTWVSPPAKSEYLNQLQQFVNGGMVLKSIIVMCFVGVLFHIYSKPPKRGHKELIVILLWWLVPYSIMLFISEKIPVFINRYILFNSIGFYVFVSAVLYLSFQVRRSIYITLAVALLVLAGLQLEINSKQFYYREVKNAVTKVKDKLKDDCVILIHPHWAHLGFTFYFNRDIFVDTRNYVEMLDQSNICPVWNLVSAIQTLDKNRNARVIYYQDGSLFNDKNNTIFKYLDSVYIRKDSVFYPQCFYVSVFDVK